MPKYYDVPYGCMGLMPSGNWMLFATSSDYLEAYSAALRPV